MVEKNYKPVKLSGCSIDVNVFNDGKRHWKVTSLVSAARDLKPFDLPLSCINIGCRVWSDDMSIKQFASHVKRCNETDPKNPVIMDEDGFIMDGWHRVVRALVEGKPTIKAVRFDSTPTCDYVVD